MKKGQRLGVILLLELLFLTLLYSSDSTPLGKVLYYLTFIVPSVIGFLYIKVRKSIEKSNLSPLSFKLNRQNTALMFITVTPCIVLIMLSAYLTEVICSTAGIEIPASVSEKFMSALFLQALVPSILEELLFRYVTLTILLPLGKKNAIFLSAILFAISHVAIYKMPYAFLAGIIFAYLDLGFSSVLPSLVIHFINNTLSITLSIVASDLLLNIIIYSTLGILLIISAIYLYKKRNSEEFKNIWKKN